MQPSFQSSLLRLSEKRRKRSRLKQFWLLVSVVGVGHEIVKRSTKPVATRQIRLRTGDQTAISLQKKTQSKQ